MLNPFDLRGPEFLAFYLALGGAVLWALVRAHRRNEFTDAAPPTLDDPYLIACLRGGEAEAINVAVLALVDRGLLQADGRWVEAVSPDAVHRAEKPLERALLVHFATSGLAQARTFDTDVRAAVRDLDAQLAQHGLLPTRAQEEGRLRRVIAAVGFLWAVALIKCLVATSRGHYNLGFLVLLALVLAGLAGFLCFGRRTAAGDRLLADLRELFQGLRARRLSLKPGASGHEPALLTAVYGLAALPIAGWAFANDLFPGKKPVSNSSCNAAGVSCGTGGGRGDGGGAGSGCGTGCGGGCGGCGGGCGGCGGG